ncbi:hypothetical protein DENSPDRAFT_883194 [Dentipellis sp. KUC8613]|nr:hypothetical protein DENSPDRAFT_883194 [Dentipellis sp. KUC8613]
MAEDPFAVIWKAAIQLYEGNTGTKIADASHAIAGIANVNALLEIIDRDQKKFAEYRNQGERIKAALRPVLNVIGTLAGAIGEGVALGFPPGKAVFAVVKLLVDATGNVKAHYDAVIDIFEQMHDFLSCCKIYLHRDAKMSDDVQHKIVKIFAHVLLVIGIVIKDMKRGRLSM